MFSIVIPLYNKENNIGETLRSVLCQTYQNFEVVIINDGSTDKSVEVVKEFNDSRIRIINQENKGVSSARNTGILNSQFEWICFLDADDLWVKNHLEEYYGAIIRNQSVDWLISGYRVVSRGSERDFVFNQKGIIDNAISALLKGLKIHTSTVCVRKDVFLNNIQLYFRDGLNNSEDREVWYKLCCINKSPYYINKVLSIYDSKVEGSLTKVKSGQKEEHFLTMFHRLSLFDKFQMLPNAEKDKFRKFIYHFNKKIIGNRYVQGEVTSNYKGHISTPLYFMLKTTSGFPKIIKKVIFKLFIS